MQSIPQLKKMCCLHKSEKYKCRPKRTLGSVYVYIYIYQYLSDIAIFKLKMLIIPVLLVKLSKLKP